MMDLMMKISFTINLHIKRLLASMSQTNIILRLILLMEKSLNSHDYHVTSYLGINFVFQEICRLLLTSTGLQFIL